MSCPFLAAGGSSAFTYRESRADDEDDIHSSEMSDDDPRRYLISSKKNKEKHDKGKQDKRPKKKFDTSRVPKLPDSPRFMEDGKCPLNFEEACKYPSGLPADHPRIPQTDTDAFVEDIISSSSSSSKAKVFLQHLQSQLLSPWTGLALFVLLLSWSLFHDERQHGVILDGLISFVSLISLGFILAVVAIISGVYLFQNRVIYVPDIAVAGKTPEQNPPGLRSPAEHGMPFEEVTVTAKDGVKLHCWLGKQSKDAESVPTLLYFHGNAGNMGLRLFDIFLLWQSCGANLFVVSYRGYGKSQGSPSEKGLVMDAQATLDHLMSRTDIDRSKVFIIGRSLGGAVAVKTAWDNPTKIRGLILENTFTSVADMLLQHYPLLAPLKSFVLRNFWPSKTLIQDLQAPILFIIGLKDNVVPPAQMQSLKGLATQSLLVDELLVHNGRHNDCWQVEGEAYHRKIKEFLQRVCIDEGLRPREGREQEQRGQVAKEHKKGRFRKEE